MNDDHHTTVAIVGAGAAGLSAAASLKQARVDYVVLEARDRTGGRLLSATVPDGRVDLGATWFWDNEPHIVKLIGEAGLASFRQYTVGDMMFQPDERGAKRAHGNQFATQSGRLTDGMQTVTEALERSVDSERLRLSTVATSVTASGDELEVETSGGTWTARHVVLAIPPALAINSIDFDDALDDNMVGLARATPVWMGATVKVVATFDRPFWRDEGLAGSAFSYTGPMREIHDMSGADGTPAAIFGFCGLPIGAPAPTSEEVTSQLVDLFGPQAASPTSVTVMDWRRETFTSPPMAEQLTNYQTYGHPLFQEPSLNGRLHWASTETSPVAPGHIEGALTAAARAVSTILSGDTQ